MYLIPEEVYWHFAALLPNGGQTLEHVLHKLLGLVVGSLSLGMKSRKVAKKGIITKSMVLQRRSTENN